MTTQPLPRRAPLHRPHSPTPAATTATVQSVARVMAAAASRTRRIHAHNAAATCEYTTRSRSAHSRPPPSAVAAPAQATRQAAVATQPWPRRAAPHRPHSPLAARPRTHTTSTTQRHAPLHSVRRARTQPDCLSDEATCRHSLELPTNQAACLMRQPAETRWHPRQRARLPV